MSTDYDSAICDFLAREENLAIALEIAARIEEVEQRLGARFWEGVRADLGQRLQQAGLRKSWDQELIEGSDGITGICLSPKCPGASESVFRYEFAEERGSANRYMIYQGILLPSSVSRAARSGLADLRDSLLEEGYRKTKRYIAWKHIREFASLKEFLLAIAGKGDQLAAGAAETFWDFIDATRARVAKLNSAQPALRTKTPRRNARK